MLSTLYRHRLFGSLSICIVALVALYFARAAVMPSFLFGSYRLSHTQSAENQLKFYRLPFEYNGDNRIAAVKLHLSIPAHFATKYDIYADDCLESFKVNDSTPQGMTFPLCGGGHQIDLSKHLQTGFNTFLFTLSNQTGPGRFDIRVSHKEWYIQFFSYAFIVVLFAFAIFYGLRLKLCRRELGLLLVFVAGASLRCLYCFATPYWIRAYDWFEHLDYIKYIMSYGGVPPALGGLQFHQPPIYYFLTASYLQLAQYFGLRYYDYISHLQVLSLILSIGSLVLGFWLMSLLPKIRHSLSSSLTFAAIISFAPAFVFSASRISNDALAEFLGILAFGLLVKWWHEQGTQNWYSFNIVAVVGILAKLSVFPVLGTGLALVGLKRDAYPEEKAKLLLASVIVIGVLSGWYFLQRHQELGNILPHKAVQVNEGLTLTNTAESFTVFNPIKLVAHPFNNSWEDQERRQYFWEYLYRSAFFGEFEFPDYIRWLAIAILLAGLPLIPFTIWGALVAVRDNWRIAQPLCILSILLLAALVTWRLLLSCSPTQDFRLISIAILPIAYFCSRGIEEIPQKYQAAALACTGLSPALWLAFLLCLCFG